MQQEADDRISTCNPAAERILGLTREQMLGRDSLDPLWQVVREDGSPYSGDQRPAMTALRTGVRRRDQVMGVYRGDGTLAWILTNAEPLYRAGENVPYAVVSSFADITALKDTEARLRHEAIHDALTGLPARRLLADRLERAAARAARYPEQHYALLFIDLDNFKGVNDALGQTGRRSSSASTSAAPSEDGSNVTNSLPAR